ncbi:MAG: oligosaccharide flippase family protein [Pseudomonadota bacterium]
MIGKFRRPGRDTLSARALRGSALVLVSQGGSQVLRLLSNLVLTRLLFPEAFGLMALVQVVLVGLEMLSAVGVRVTIIQHPRGRDPLFLNTAWVVQIGRGVLIWLVVLAAAGPVSAFYGHEELQFLLIVAGISVVISGFQSTNMASANRELVLGRLTIVELGAQTLAILMMILLAWLTGSVWALIFGRITMAISLVTLSHTILPGIRNRPAWDPKAFWDIFHFGKYILFGSAAAFVISNGDRAVLGKFVSLAELGVYNIGFVMATLPIVVARRLSSQILLPYFVHAREGDTGLQRQRIRRARSAVALGFISVSLFLALIGDWLIGVLYSDAYRLAGPLTVLIALAFIPSIILEAYSQYLLASGRSAHQSILVTMQASLQLALMIFFVGQYGLIGAVMAPPLAIAAIYAPTAFIMRKQGIWDPKLDIALLLYAIAGAVFVLWVNDTAIAQVISGIPDDG